MINRRAFLKQLGVSAVLAGAGELGSLSQAFAAMRPASPGAGRLVVFPDRDLNALPADYTGISCETMQLTDPTYFAPDNLGLVALCRRLSPNGVLRLGGNSSEFCWWKDSPAAVPPVHRTVGQGRADNWMPQSFHAITPAAVDNLAGFLEATGWTLIYGLNFGTGSPARDSVEAEYVAKAVGSRLKYFQIGNEPDFYSMANNLLRPPGWGFHDYLNEWTAIANAVSARVPSARFGGPDVGATSDWVIQFAQAAPARVGGRLMMLSGHYYAEGPPDSPMATIKRLLAPNPVMVKRMRAVMAAAHKAKLDYRMTEGNSCYRGGKPRMSNALAGALWGADYMLAMAALGAKGINFHCGSGTQIAASLGGKLPGARTAADKAVAKLGSFYSPIAGSRDAAFTARPIFYGMMLAEQFAGTTMVGTHFDCGSVNATAYAARTANGYRIALINKDEWHDLSVTISANGAAFADAGLWRLTGPALTATEGIRLGGAEVGPDAAWQPADVQHVPAQSGILTLDLPRASAALLLI